MHRDLRLVFEDGGDDLECAGRNVGARLVGEAEGLLRRQGVGLRRGSYVT
jgi:hypothetical protein